MKIPRVNFYRKKVRKVKSSKFLIAMGIILLLGFSFYFVSSKMMDKIYANALSADQNLLNAAGISSFSALSKEDIQRRIDDQIARYSTLLNSKSRVLSYMKDTLEGVNDFHYTFYSVQNVFEKFKSQISLATLEYSTASSTPIEMVQFGLEDSSVPLEEKSYFEKLGYKVQLVENAGSKWYKTKSEKIYLFRREK